MTTWMRFGIGVAALVLAVAIGTGAYAMRGTDDPPRRQAIDLSAKVPSDADTHADADAPQDGGGLAAICIEGTADCNDTPGIEYGDFGESEKCAADAVGCTEPAACPQDGCDGGIIEECVILETEPPVTQCRPVDCGVPAPAIEPGIQEPILIDPVPVEPLPLDPDVIDVPLPMPAPAEGAFTADPCVPVEDPCVAADACLPPDCAVSSDGAIACPEPFPMPAIPPCEVPPDQPQGSTDFKPSAEQMPCAVSPCLGNDPRAGVPEACPSPPCTVFTTDAPEGVPCDEVDPCILPMPPVGAPGDIGAPGEIGAPEDAVPVCPPGVSEPGSPGEGGGSSGSDGETAEGAPVR